MPAVEVLRSKRWIRLLRTAATVALALDKANTRTLSTGEPGDGQAVTASATRQTSGEGLIEARARGVTAAARHATRPSPSKTCSPSWTAAAGRSNAWSATAIQVSADIFKEGHDLLQARVVYRALDEPLARGADAAGRERSLAGRFSVDRNTRYVYSVLAFTDTYGSWRADLQKRLAAAQDVDLRAARRPAPGRGSRRPLRRVDDRGRLQAYLARWRAGDARAAAELAISEELGEVMDRCPDRSDATRYRHELQLVVDRPAARFAAWYEIFPRSQGTDSDAQRDVPRSRSATAGDRRDGLRHAVHDADPSDRHDQSQRARTTRWSPVRTTQAVRTPSAARPADTTRSHPSSARWTISCTSRTSPASTGWSWCWTSRSRCRPTIRGSSEHPEWFYHRPDGTIKFAENPPKKYEDIYPLNFRSPDWKNLWAALARHHPAVGGARRARVPRRQSAHQAAGVLGVDDSRGPGRAIRTRSSWPRRSRGRR